MIEITLLDGVLLYVFVGAAFSTWQAPSALKHMESDKEPDPLLTVYKQMLGDWFPTAFLIVLFSIGLVFWPLLLCRLTIRRMARKPPDSPEDKP